MQARPLYKAVTNTARRAQLNPFYSLLQAIYIEGVGYAPGWRRDQKVLRPQFCIERHLTTKDQQALLFKIIFLMIEIEVCYYECN
ncbi:hypothetical protein CXF78_18205 [Shewanella sp. 11B5]|nr:hypothetical protein CXF78_18205 [Shewanella sp. 11B5]RPA28069.1 hypothetical protein EGC78_16345 [Shewanella frigidimarina]